MSDESCLHFTEKNMARLTSDEKQNKFKSYKDKILDLTENTNLCDKEHALAELLVFFRDQPYWMCPYCGNDETWFDRALSYEDGEHPTMCYRCTKCGRKSE